MATFKLFMHRYISLLILCPRAVISLCPAGTRVRGSGCRKCDAGTFSSTEHSFSCSDCAGGKYSQAGASECQTCSSGQYSMPRSRKCQYTVTSCPAGTYADAQASCSLCTTGKASSVAGSQSADDCVECSPGHFEEYAGSTACTRCQAGRYQPQSGDSLCLACPAGTSSSVRGATDLSVCLSCSPGKFSDVDGSSECSKCPAGQFQPGTASISCRECSAGTSTNGRRGRSKESECKECKADFVSKQDGLGACSPCVHPDGCESTSTCREGYHGESCFLCNDGWYHNGDECQKCSALTLSSFYWLFMIIVFLLVCKILYRFADHDSTMAPLFICLTHLQLVGVYLVNYRLNYPPIIEWIGTNFGVYLTFDLLEMTRYECVGKLWYPWQWGLSYLLPVFSLLPFVYYLKRTVEEPLERLRWGCALALLESIQYYHVFSAALVVRACRERSDGSLALEAQPSLTCSSFDTQYATITTFAGISFSVTLAIVSYCLYFISLDRGDGSPHASNPFRMLSVCYKRTGHYKYWSVAVLGLKIMSALTTLFLSDDPTGQVIAMLAMVLFVLLLQLRFKPYIISKNNTLDQTNLWLQVIHLLFAWSGFKGYLGREIVDIILVAVFFIGLIMNVFFCVRSFFCIEADVKEAEEQLEKDASVKKPDDVEALEAAAAAAAEKANAEKEAKRLQHEALQQKQHEWLDGALERQKEAAGGKSQQKQRLLQRSTSGASDYDQATLLYQQQLQRRYEVELT